MYASTCGVVGEIPLLYQKNSHRWFDATGTRQGGQFGWGGLLLKCNGGVQRLAQYGWQSYVACKGISQLNCERDISSRYESRS